MRKAKGLEKRSFTSGSGVASETPLCSGSPPIQVWLQLTKLFPGSLLLLIPAPELFLAASLFLSQKAHTEERGRYLARCESKTITPRSVKPDLLPGIVLNQPLPQRKAADSLDSARRMTDSWRSWWGSLTEAGWAMGVSSCCPPLPGSGPGTVLRVDCSLPVWMSFVSHQLEAPAVPPVEDQVLLPQAWEVSLEYS